MTTQKDVAQSNISQLMAMPILDTGHDVISFEVDTSNPDSPSLLTELVATDSTFGLIGKKKVLPNLAAQLMDSPGLLNNGTPNSFKLHIYNTSERFTVETGTFFLELRGVPDDAWETGLASASDLSKVAVTDIKVDGMPDGITASVTKVKSSNFYDSRFVNLTAKHRKNLPVLDKRNYEIWSMLSQNSYSAWFMISFDNRSKKPILGTFGSDDINYFAIHISSIITNLISGHQGAFVRIHPHNLNGVDVKNDNSPISYMDAKLGHAIFSVIAFNRSVMVEKDNKIYIGTNEGSDDEILYVKGNTTFETNDIRSVQIKNMIDKKDGVAELYLNCPFKKGSKLGTAVGYDNKDIRDFYIWIDGYDRLNITKEGKVSIGKNASKGIYTEPVAQFQVTAEKGNNLAMFKKDDDGIGLTIDDQGQVGIGAAALTGHQLKVTAKSTFDQVGIGTPASDTQQLYVKGQTIFESDKIRPVHLKNTATGDAGVAEVYLDCPNKKDSKLGAAVGYGNKANRDFYIWVDGYDRLNITKDGKVSIGKKGADGTYTAPNAQFQVKADAGNSVASFQTDSGQGLNVNEKGNVKINGDLEITGNFKMGNWLLSLDNSGNLQIANNSSSASDAQSGPKLLVQYGSDQAEEVIRNNDPYTILNLNPETVDRYLWSSDTSTSGKDDCHFCNDDNGKYKKYANFKFSKYHYE
ncbi:MAG: hypothetical protein AAFZ15_23110 [Bacteroidota bacterium]